MRIAGAVIALVLAVAACDRVVELFPTPADAHTTVLPDAATQHGVPDAFVGSDGGFDPDAGITPPDSNPDAS